MKKELLMVCAVVALVGCDKSDRGGMGSDTTVDTSTPRSTNYDSRTSGSGSSTLTNTNRLDRPQGSAPQQGGTQQGSQPQTTPPQQPQTTP
jgi:hypothetical protein